MKQISIDALRCQIAARNSRAPYSSAEEGVRAIIDCVKRDGDAALKRLAWQIDGVDLESSALEVTEAELDGAASQLSSDLRRAIDYAAEAVYDYHLITRPKTERVTTSNGVQCIRRVDPLGVVGVYSPKGHVGYPSSVIMCSSAARAAGVSQIVLCTPPLAGGEVSAQVLYAAKVSGVTRVFKVGGPAAIAAMAFGTTSIPRVDKIVGPGNEYVCQAKRLLYGVTGIDMVAGPSEVAIIADAGANAETIAFDLLAQAEHGEKSWAVLLTDSKRLMFDVARVIEATPAGSLAGRISAVLCESLIEAANLASEVAPEHLEIFVQSPLQLLESVRNAGAVFVGPAAGAALGDFALGPNHVLPTSGGARFCSGLSTIDFCRVTNVVAEVPLTEPLLLNSQLLAECEGFKWHARSIRHRRSSAGGKAE